MTIEAQWIETPVTALWLSSANSFFPYVLPLLVAALLSILVGVYTWPRRHVRGAQPLFFITIAIAIWSGGYGLELLATSLSTKLWWSKTQYLGIAFTPYLWLLFSVAYSEKKRTRWWSSLRLLVIIPITTFLLAVTNEWHGLIWTEINLVQDPSLPILLLDTTYGPWFWLHLSTAYLFMLVGTLVLLAHLWQLDKVYHSQVIAVMVAALAPWLSNMVYMFGFGRSLPLDLTPFALTVTVLALGWAVFGYRLVDIVPIARDLVLEGMREGVIVVDGEGRVVDINSAAAQVVGLPVGRIVGKGAADVLAPWPHLLAYLQSASEGLAEMVIGQGEAQLVYGVRIVPLYNQQQQALGHILTIQQGSPETAVFPSTPVTPTLSAETAVLPPIPQNTPPFIQTLITFFIPPPLEDADNILGQNPLINQLTEQAFTAMLRFVAIIGILGLIIIYSHFALYEALPTKIAFTLGVLLTIGLSLTRTIKFAYRVRLFLTIIYIISSVEVASYGYTIEAFLLFFTLIALTTLLQGSRAGLAVALLTFLTLASFGWQIITGNYHPLSVPLTDPILPTNFTLALANLFVFAASASTLIVIISFITQSINKAWQQEIQTRNLLQHERDRLDERVIARTQQLQQREAILEAVSASSEQLLKERDWEKSIATILTGLGQATAASRVYLFEKENTPPGQPVLVSQRYEWVAPGITPQVSNPELYKFPLSERFPRWLSYFERGESINGLVKEFPTSERIVLEAQQILSIVIMPIMVNETWHGFIGFDECLGEREWTLPEVEAILIAANNLGSAIQRQQQEQILAKSEAQQRALLKAIPDLIFRNHRDGTFLDYNVGNSSELLVSPDQFMGKKPSDVLTPDLAQTFMQLIEEALETGNQIVYEYTLPIQGNLADFEARIVVSGPNEVLSIVRNITERRKLQAQTVALALEKERSLLLRQFVQNTSHEFRTPLSVINMTLSTLGRFKDEQAQQRSIQRAKQQIPRMIRLLDMTLSMIRLDNENVVLQGELVDLNQFMGQIMDGLEETAVSKNVHIALQPDTSLPPIPVDINWLNEAFTQILTNSIHFTPAGGAVTIRITKQEDQAIVQIQDTGPGISPENLPHIFERFWRSDKAHTQPGFGLGLPIAQKIIEMHNGQIKVTSNPEIGTTVTVTLPLKKAKKSVQK